MLTNPELPTRKPRKSHKTRTLVTTLSIVAAVALIVLGVREFLSSHNFDLFGERTEETTEPAELACAESEIAEDGVCVPKTPTFVDLSAVVNNWANNATGLTSVYVYDLDHDRVAGEFYAEKAYNTASLYKLFVVYEGYLRVAEGTWRLEEPYLENAAGSFTRGDCLDLALRESYSPCAEKLWDEIGRDALDEIIATKFGITNSDISNLTSNVVDVASMLKIYYAHTGLSDELVNKIKDSMLTQPPTNKEGTCENLCDWRQGLPSGFSDKAKVYNKVGWLHSGRGQIWSYYHDAAIVELPDPTTSATHHYVVVVMTSNSYVAEISDFASQLEAAVASAQPEATAETTEDPEDAASIEAQSP